MNTTAGKITIVVGLSALVALTLFFFLAVERGKRGSVEPVFQLPVYKSGVPDGILASPLFLDADTASTAVSAIAEFKRAVLMRITSPHPLSDAEKSVLRASISTINDSRAGTLILANQTLLRFTSDEIARIESVLKK